MKEVWTHSMDGFPWTKNKMTKAIEILRPNATITFAFGYEKVLVLEILNEIVFKVRPDLILHVWSVASDHVITEQEIEYLNKMNYVNKLHVNAYLNKFLDLSKMKQLISLKLWGKNKLDISFLSNLKSLKEISLTGKFSSLNSIKDCTELEFIYLSTTIDSFDFFKGLN